jgi:hypothetical protein
MGGLPRPPRRTGCAHALVSGTAPLHLRRCAAFLAFARAARPCRRKRGGRAVLLGERRWRGRQCCRFGLEFGERPERGRRRAPARRVRGGLQGGHEGGPKRGANRVPDVRTLGPRAPHDYRGELGAPPSVRSAHSSWPPSGALVPPRTRFCLPRLARRPSAMRTTRRRPRGRRSAPRTRAPSLCRCPCRR